MADIAASVLAKLRNKAKDSGISYQQCLQLFMQEEFLRKLSKSGYDDFLVLKGGLFIYTLTNFESRATIDVDFLLRGYSNSINNVKDTIWAGNTREHFASRRPPSPTLHSALKITRDYIVDCYSETNSSRI